MLSFLLYARPAVVTPRSKATRIGNTNANSTTTAPRSRFGFGRAIRTFRRTLAGLTGTYRRASEFFKAQIVGGGGGNAGNHPDE
jgi:hypothetical protein